MKVQTTPIIKTTSLEKRFWQYVTIADGDQCWPWIGSRNPAGYGHLTIDGHHVSAHRIGYVVQRDPIPDQTCVLHECDNPPCVRGSHLFLGGYLENTLDCIAKGRAKRSSGDKHWARVSPPRGEANSRAILTSDDVRSIRMRAADGEQIAALARELNMSEGAIRNIVKLRNWKHVT